MNTPFSSVPGPRTNSAVEEAEAALRHIASLAAPEGLEDRVKARLKAGPPKGRVLAWPTSGSSGESWARSTVARGAAAAAIVLAVAGGSWGVYSRVQPAEQPQRVVMPRVVAPGGFSGAGAVRTPQTLKGPVLKHPVEARGQASTHKKSPAATAKDRKPMGKPSASQAAQPSEPAATSK